MTPFGGAALATHAAMKSGRPCACPGKGRRRLSIFLTAAWSFDEGHELDAAAAHFSHPDFGFWLAHFVMAYPPKTRDRLTTRSPTLRPVVFS